jgi:hypothetical protein
MWFLGAVVYSVLVLGVVFVTEGGTRLAARQAFVPDFRWFAGAPAEASLVRRAFVRLGGTIGPFLLSVLIYFCAAFLGGSEEPTTTVEVMPGPAREAGMQSGDRIVGIDRVKVDEWGAVRPAFQSRTGPVNVEIARADKHVTLSITPDLEHRIGIRPIYANRAVGALPALAQAVTAPFRVAGALLKQTLAVSSAPVQLAGPVGIVREVSSSHAAGSMGLFIANLSAYLWLQVLGVQLFDVVTLLVFRASHREVADAPDQSLRLCRLRQSLVIALAAYLLLVALCVPLDLVPGAHFGLPALVLAAGALAIYPLIWIAATCLWPHGSARVPWIIASLVPCIAPVAAAWLFVRLGRALSERGFKVGFWRAARA